MAKCFATSRSWADGRRLPAAPEMSAASQPLAQTCPPIVVVDGFISTAAVLCSCGQVRRFGACRFTPVPRTDLGPRHAAPGQSVPTDDLLIHAPGGGGSPHALATRAHAWADEVLQQGQPALAVTHGGPINALPQLPWPAARIDSSHWASSPGHGALTRLLVSFARGHRVAQA